METRRDRRREPPSTKRDNFYALKLMLIVPIITFCYYLLKIKIKITNTAL